MVHGLGEIERKGWSWVGHRQVTIAQVWAKGKERRRGGEEKKEEKKKRRENLTQRRRVRRGIAEKRGRGQKRDSAVC
jgi:hypothetical protein